MFVLGGLALVLLGGLLFFGRRVFGAMNELSNTVLTGRTTPLEGGKAWTYTPAGMGIAMAVAGVGLLVFSTFRAIGGL